MPTKAKKRVIRWGVVGAAGGFLLTAVGTYATLASYSPLAPHKREVLKTKTTFSTHDSGKGATLESPPGTQRSTAGSRILNAFEQFTAPLDTDTEQLKGCACRLNTVLTNWRTSNDLEISPGLLHWLPYVGYWYAGQYSIQFGSPNPEGPQINETFEVRWNLDLRDISSPIVRYMEFFNYAHVSPEGLVIAPLRADPANSSSAYFPAFTRLISGYEIEFLMSIEDAHLGPVALILPGDLTLVIGDGNSEIWTAKGLDGYIGAKGWPSEPNRRTATRKRVVLSAGLHRILVRYAHDRLSVLLDGSTTVAYSLAVQAKSLEPDHHKFGARSYGPILTIQNVAARLITPQPR